MKRDAAEKVKAASAEAKLNTGLALAALMSQVGAHDPEELAGVLEGTTSEMLVEEGRKIASQRVLDDSVRIYQQVWLFMSGAAPALVAQLKGTTLSMIALGVFQALELQKLLDRHNAHEASDTQERDDKDIASQRAYDTGLRLRDQLEAALKVGAGQDEGRKNAIANAVGTADTGETLARGMEALVTLGRSWLAGESKPMLARLKLGGVDEAYLAEVAARAGELLAAAGAAQLRPATARVTQAELDYADGINLLILKQVIQGFQQSHLVNSMIPRVVPISTASYFGRKASKAKATPATKAKTQKAAAKQANAATNDANAATNGATPAAGASATTPSNTQGAAPTPALKAEPAAGQPAPSPEPVAAATDTEEKAA